MTDQEKNKIIACWLGWSECSDMPTTTQARWDSGVGKRRILPDWINTNAAFDLLDALTERGNIPALTSHISEDGETYWRFKCCDCDTPSHSEFQAEYKSKSRAIVEAIILLLEKEK